MSAIKAFIEAVIDKYEIIFSGRALKDTLFYCE